MTFKVVYSGTSNYSVKLGSAQKIKVVASNYMANRLNDLTDVQITDSSDKYLLMYDSAIGKWRNVNPDEVLIAATTDQTPGYIGIPSVFENQLSVDLDNQIDVDAGTF